MARHSHAAARGAIQSLFDGDPDTAVTARSGTPLVIEIALPTAQPLQGLILSSDSRELRVLAEVYAGGDAQAGRYENTITQMRAAQPIELEFDPPPGAINRIRLTLTDPTTPAIVLRTLALSFTH